MNPEHNQAVADWLAWLASTACQAGNFRRAQRLAEELNGHARRLSETPNPAAGEAVDSALGGLPLDGRQDIATDIVRGAGSMSEFAELQVRMYGSNDSGLRMRDDLTACAEMLRHIAVRLVWPDTYRDDARWVADRVRELLIGPTT